MNLSPKATVIGMIVDADLSVSEFLSVAKFFLDNDYEITQKAIPSEQVVITPTFNSANMAEMINHMMAGRKIDAIKVYRAATGLGLGDAKEAVEDLQVRIRI